MDSPAQMPKPPCLPSRLEGLCLLEGGKVHLGMVDLETALEAALGLLGQIISGSLVSMDVSLSKHRKIVKNGEAWRAALHGVAESDSTEQLNNIWFNALPRPFLQAPPISGHLTHPRSALPLFCRPRLLWPRPADCTCRLLARLKRLPQASQPCGRSSLCTSR